VIALLKWRVRRPIAAGPHLRLLSRGIERNGSLSNCALDADAVLMSRLAIVFAAARSLYPGPPAADLPLTAVSRFVSDSIFNLVSPRWRCGFLTPLR